MAHCNPHKDSHYGHFQRTENYQKKENITVALIEGIYLANISADTQQDFSKMTDIPVAEE